MTVVLASILLLSSAALAQGSARTPGPVATDDIPKLIGQLQLMDKTAVEKAVQDLANRGAIVVPYLLPYLDDERVTQSLRIGALQVLEALGPEARTAKPKLVGLLDHESWAFRSRAVLILSKIGPEARDALPKIRALLDDESPIVRRLALFTAALLSEDRQAFLPRLGAALDDTDVTVRIYAVRTMTQLYGPRAVPLFEKVVDQLDEPSGDLQNFTVQALAAMGPAVVPGLIARMESGEQGQIRVRSTEALGFIKPPTEAQLDALARAYRSDDPQLAAAAGSSLTRLGGPAVSRLAPLLESADADRATKKRVMNDLGTIGAAAGGEWPRLAAFLDDEDEDMRYAATVAIRRIGTAASDAADVMMQRLSDPSVRIRIAAIQAFGMFKAGAKQAIPELTRILVGDDARLGKVVVEAFIVIGEHAAPAIEPLLGALDSEDIGVRSRAIAGLAAIGEPAIAPLVDQLRGDAPARVKRGVLQSIRQMGTVGAKALPAAAEHLSSKDILLRRDAVLALSRYRQQSLPYLDQVLRLAEDPDRGVRAAAVMALGMIGRDKDPVFKTLVERLADHDPGVALAAIDSLGYPGNARAVPVLVDLLGNEDEYVRFHAARALGAIGPDAARAIPDMERASRREKEHFVVIAIGEAIQKIRGDR